MIRTELPLDTDFEGEANILLDIINAFQMLLEIDVILFLVLGCLIGVIFGLIPGLGSIQALVLVLPFTFWLDPVVAVYLYSGIMGAAGGAGAVTAILINTPGIPINITSTFDGYPMTLKGEAARAISMSTIGATIGSLLTLVIVALTIPLVKIFILSFGTAEIFWIILFGVVTISLISKGNTLKGIISGGLGFLLSFIGYTSMGDVERFTFGSETLWQGIQLVPFFMGVFAIPQILQYLSGMGTIVNSNIDNVQIEQSNVLSQIYQGLRDVIKHWVTVVRSSIIGFVIGVIPGIGGVTAAFLSYSAEVQSSKDKSKFGKGSPEGLIASDSSIHACTSGALLPTLSLGIPGSVEMAVFLGILIMHGVQPGPRLLTEHTGIVWGLIVGLAAAQFVSSAMIFSSTWWFNKITGIRTKYLGPVLAVVVFVGTYAINNSIWDVGIALLGGIGAWFLTRYGYPIAPLGIGFILGPMLEKSYLQTLMVNYGRHIGFVSSWVSIAMMLLLVLGIISMAIPKGKIKVGFLGGDNSDKD